MSFKIIPQFIPEVLLIEHKEFTDDRGAFSETFRANAFTGIGLQDFVQDNQSRSAKGVVRGLHFQNNPHAIGKLVRCISGSIFDVAVDLRQSSPTYGKWVGATLSESDSLMFYVPEGFAHGFMALDDNTIVAYKQTGYWNQETERSLLWNDPTIAIAWPNLPPRLSAKDENAPKLSQLDHNL